MQARRLNLKVEKIRETYISTLESLFKRNYLYELLQALERKAECPASKEVADALKGLDKQTTELVLSTERDAASSVLDTTSSARRSKDS